MINDIKTDAKSRMEKSIEALGHAFAKIRTGRAHPSILDAVRVDYYGAEVPISQVANISVEDARTLAVTPWEKPMVGEVEKAIMKSDLGLNPASAGGVVASLQPTNNVNAKATNGSFCARKTAWVTSENRSSNRHWAASTSLM